jgi:indole-3-glycerol phosphate synthase
MAHDLGMQVIMEVHTIDQVNKYNDYIETIGVNNRDLKTFKTDINHSIDIFKQLPSSAVKISESGILNSVHAIQLKSCGYDGFLIGELFMKTVDPGKALTDFISETTNKIL